MEYRTVFDFVICSMPSDADLDMNEISEIIIEKLLSENSILRFMTYDKL